LVLCVLVALGADKQILVHAIGSIKVGNINEHWSVRTLSDRINSIPTMITLKDGVLIENLAGFMPEKNIINLCV